MNIEPALAIGGWMTDRELHWLADTASKCKTIIEVGSFRGRSTTAMAENSDATIWCVDAWNAVQPGRVIDDNDFMAFWRNMRPYRGRIIPIRLEAAKAATLLREEGLRADLVFIDASHDYDSIVADIHHYRPFAKGGIVAGHDLNPSSWPGVVRAVKELCGTVDRVDTIWWKDEV